MSTLTPELVRNCRRCSSELVPGSLVCEKCHALVYSEQLEKLADEAKTLERQGDLQHARERWLAGLPLLPANSTQAHWIAEHARSLDAATQFPHLTSRASPKISRQSSLNLGFVFSFLLFLGVYSLAAGAKFGIGFAVLILIHEMGHYIDIRRRGLPADMPLFLPGVGAYVRWRAMGISLETRAAVSLAGPLAGFLAALACAAIWWQTRDSYWLVLARVGAAVNLLNLIPVSVLDGGQAASALAKSDRIALLVFSLILAFALRDYRFLLVFAGGAAYRAFFTSDLPAHPSRFSTAYFLAVLTALAIILRVLPGHGFSIE